MKSLTDFISPFCCLFIVWLEVDDLTCDRTTRGSERLCTPLRSEI